MTYPEETLTQISSLGQLGYPVRKIISIIKPSDPDQFLLDFETTGSPLAVAYQRGVDAADYAIDDKLLSMAKEGDIEALRKLEERKRDHLRKERL